MSLAYRPESKLKSYRDFYATVARTAVQQQFQYRAANYAYMIGMIAEPIIYLVVWSTVAESRGGEVGGFTAGEFAAYYIVWTLVRNMNIVLTPYEWEWRIREGELSKDLLRPIHPLHFDVAYFAGWKVVAIVMWIPLALVLAAIFRPTLDVTWGEAVVFFVAIWGAYMVRTMFLWVLGLVTLWTTRVSALYELFFALELLLSGRLVPLSLMPPWARDLANFLPFKWTFGFPIEVLVADLSGGRLLSGLGMQVLWTLAGLAAVQVLWRYGIRRYTAVNN